MKKKLVMAMIGVMLLTSFAGCGNKKIASHDAGAKVEQSAKDSAKSKTKAAKQKTGEEKKWFVYYYGAVANGSTKDVKVDLHKLFKEK